MISILLIIVLWTWCLTPLWVNIVGTVLLGLRITFKIIKCIVEIIKEANER